MEKKKRQTVRKTREDLFQQSAEKFLAETGLDKSFQEVLEEDFPDYEINGGKTVRKGGEIVEQEELIKDYIKLKTEVRRLDQLSQELYRNNQHNATLVKLQTIQEKKRSWSSIIVFGTIILAISIFSYYAYKMKEQESLNQLNAREKEKQLVEQQLEQQRQEAKEKLKLLEDRFVLEKRLLETQLQNSKEKELQKLRENSDGQVSETSLKEMEQKLENKYRNLYNNLQTSLTEKLEQERKIQRQELEKSKTQIKEYQTKEKELQLLRDDREKLEELLVKAQDQLTKLQNQAQTSQTSQNPPVNNGDTNRPSNGSSEKEISLGPGSYDGRQLILKSVQQNKANTEIAQVTFVSARRTIVADLYIKQQGDKTQELLRIIEPKQMRGEAYLFVSSSQGRNFWRFDTKEQKYVREQQETQLFDSEFTYNDWFGNDIEGYEYEYVTQRELQNRDTHVVLAKALPPTKQYSKKYFWMDIANNIPLQIKYFDSFGKLSKIYFVQNIQKVQNVWRPKSTFIVNAKNRQKTKVTFSNWQINVAIPDRIFSPESLYKR